MIDINSHPIWKNIDSAKKPLHLLRIFLAGQYSRLYPRSLFVGITGSVGKTTTAVASYAILAEKYKALVTSVNLDPILNIPITLLKVRPNIKKVILEMGVEYPGEMDFYLTLVRPSTAIVTRIFLAHSEFLGGLENIAFEKGKLVEQLPKDGVAILNWDDPIVRKIAEMTSAQVVFYGTDPNNCHIWASNITIKNFRTSFELNYGAERVEVESLFLGAHQIYPLLAAAALGVCEQISLIKIKRALEKVEPAPHRLQPLPGHHDSIILDDTHNSSPLALEEALDTINLLPARRRILVLGEMRELGQFSEKMHREIARKIYKDKIDLVFLGMGETKYIAEELLTLGFIPDRLQANLQNPQIVSKLLKILSKGDIVLIKGSRAVRLDEVVRKLCNKKE